MFPHNAPMFSLLAPRKEDVSAHNAPWFLSVCPPAIGIVNPEIMNSSHTGRVQGEAVSRNRDSLLSRKRLGTGCVSRDNRLPPKTYGRTRHLMESGSCCNPRNQSGPTSMDRLPQNKNGSKMHA